MKLRDLATTDYTNVEVQSFDQLTGTTSLSPVKYWIHAQPERPSTYVHLHTESGIVALLC